MDATPSHTDRDAFEALVLRHQVAICAVAYAILRDRARSEEVAQDALLVAWRDRAKVTITPGWLCGIARNLARNAARRRREVVMDREPAADDYCDARNALIAHEDISRASAALERLPAKYREAIAIYYRSNESYSEVAAALEITEAAARQRVHRGRERLRERQSIVETALRATRPGKAFTAAAVAAWAIGRSPSAGASTLGASKPVWLLPAIGLGAIAATVGAVVVVRAASIDHDPSPGSATDIVRHDTRTPTARRYPLMSRGTIAAPRPPVLPAPFTPAVAPTIALGTASNTTVELDFKQAPFDHLMQLFAHESQTPIWSTIESVLIDIRVRRMPVLDALDLALTQAHATRTEVEAIRIVESGPNGAAALGGERMSLSLRDVPFNRVLDLVEPKLGIPIARVGRPFRVIESSGEVVEDQSKSVTLELTDVPAGVVLQRALEQTGYGYEITTGFLITPD